VVLTAVRSSHLPPYSCKYSRKTYTQHQLRTILLSREALGTDYRDTVNLIELLDIHKQVILCIKISQHPVHDVSHATLLLRQCQRVRKAACYVMDKGYDAETLHRQIREEMGADSVIPVRTWQGRIRSRTYRQEIYANFDKERYQNETRSKRPF
jgi:hypothetical protein